MKPHGSDFESGIPLDIYGGYPGSWLEPSEPPSYCVPVDVITLTPPDDEQAELIISQLIEFDVSPDDSGWVGWGTGTIRSILSVFGQSTRVMLGAGTITYTGPTLPQSQRGRE